MHVIDHKLFSGSSVCYKGGQGWCNQLYIHGIVHGLCPHIEAISVLMTLLNPVCGLPPPVAKVMKYAVH